jgi:hypothetical protein
MPKGTLRNVLAIVGMEIDELRKLSQNDTQVMIMKAERAQKWP